VNIAGATSQTYTPVTADVGSTLRVVVTASNTAGASSATSPVSSVATQSPVNTVAPAITGATQDGQTLSATAGSWVGTSPISYSYQWRRCGYSGAVLADKPLAYWRLGETSGTTAVDHSGNGRHATYVSVTLGRTGAFGGDPDTAIGMDGTATSYVIRNPFGSFPTSAVSVEFWMKTLDANKSAGIFSYAVPSNDNEFQVRDYRNFTIIRGSKSVATNVSANDGNWHDIVVTWRGSDGQTQLFKDGKLAYSGTLASGTSITGSSGAVVLGQDQDTVGGGFEAIQAYLGTLDDVSLYNAALTATQAQTHYAAAGTPTCSDISGATNQTYTLTSSDVGKTVRVVVTAANGAGTTAASSNETNLIAPGPPSNTTPPSITGTAENGQTLSADPGTWSGTPPFAYAYQWKKCDAGGANCAAVSGATSQTYTLSSSDVGSTLRVVLTASNSTGSSVATSAASQVIGNDSVVMAAGDIACGTGSVNTGGACQQLATSNLLVNGNPTQVLTLGDNQYDCGTLSDFQTFFDPTWGRAKSKMYPTPGNHEYQVDTGSTLCNGLPAGAPGYFSYFGVAATPQSPSCTQSCSGYYSFDLGNWHLISINSNCPQIGGCATGSPEETWLQGDLAATTKPCVLAYWHHPRFSSGSHSLDPTAVAMNDIWNDLYNAHADLVLVGHDHDYERFALLGPGGPDQYNPTTDPVSGLREIIVGTGGRSQTGFGSNIRTGSEVRSSGVYGVLKVVLRPNSYDWQFVPVAGQTFTDSGSTTCH